MSELQMSDLHAKRVTADPFSPSGPSTIDDLQRALVHFDQLLEQAEMVFGAALRPTVPSPNEQQVDGPPPHRSTLSTLTEELHMRIRRFEQLLGRCDL